MSDDWVKRLGQWHKSETGATRTRCGMPMLGNNYARLIKPEDREKCPICHEEVKYRMVVVLPAWKVLRSVNAYLPADEQVSQVDELSLEIVKELIISDLTLEECNNLDIHVEVI